MSAAVPRDAATVVIVRDAASGRGIEVLLLQRAERGDHNSGAWVFPGGLVDPGDRAAGASGGLDDARASANLSLPQGGLAFYRAAVRECFEESGILFAQDSAGGLAALPQAQARALDALRAQCQAGTCTIDAICAQLGLKPAPERLHYIAHWLTPAGRAKRFDTRFFLAVAPHAQSAMHDQGETTDHVWITPAQALDPSHARRLMGPTRAMLKLLEPFSSTEALDGWARQPRRVERVLPRLVTGAQGLTPILAGHPAYEEAGKLDPDGLGHVHVPQQPGQAVRIGDQVERITTAQGRNRYRIGSDAGGWTDLPEGAVHLAAQDRILVAPDRAHAPEALKAQADWLALAEGFLVRCP